MGFAPGGFGERGGVVFLSGLRGKTGKGRNGKKREKWEEAIRFAKMNGLFVHGHGHGHGTTKGRVGYGSTVEYVTVMYSTYGIRMYVRQQMYGTEEVVKNGYRLVLRRPGEASDLSSGLARLTKGERWRPFERSKSTSLSVCSSSHVIPPPPPRVIIIIIIIIIIVITAASVFPCISDQWNEPGDTEGLDKHRSDISASR